MMRMLCGGRLVAMVAVILVAGTAMAVADDDPEHTAGDFFKQSVRLEPAAAELARPEEREAYRSLLIEALDQWEQSHPDMPFGIWVTAFDFSGLNFSQVHNDGEKAEVAVTGEYSIQAGGVVATRPVELRIHLKSTESGWLVSRP